MRRFGLAVGDLGRHAKKRRRITIGPASGALTLAGPVPSLRETSSSFWWACSIRGAILSVSAIFSSLDTR
eukprot:scaffold6899_cov183-Amphora_coffeaeformis.AAC.48